jgi:hypothetical protein
VSAASCKQWPILAEEQADRWQERFKGAHFYDGQMVSALREAQPDLERSRQRTRVEALEAALQKGTPSPCGGRPGPPLCESVPQPPLLPSPGALAQLAPAFARAYFTNRNATTVLTCGYYVRSYCSFLLSSHQSCCSSAVVASALVQAGFTGCYAPVQLRV